MKTLLRIVGLGVVILLAAHSVPAATFTFSTGLPDGKIATASRPSSGAGIEIESADDFLLPSSPSTFTRIDHATFFGLLPSGALLSSVSKVIVEIYDIFPLDSTNPPSGNVPTRVNSPSDVDLDSRDSAGGTLTFTPAVVSATFSATNSVVNGINPSPNQFTGGEGSVTGEEVEFDVTFNPPLVLPSGHYFFVPQVLLSSGNFLWLSAPKPIVAPGTPFASDLQSWIRNSSLAPDWLRIGTDITHQGPFNATFSLAGESGGPASVSATKTVVGNFAPGDTVTYTVVLTNAGPGDQLDNPGHEFTDALPSALALVNATASIGAITSVGNTVNWDGAIPASSSVTITITASITGNSGVVANQGTVNYDVNGDGSNQGSAVTDDPTRPGETDPTTFTIATIPMLGSLGIAALISLLAGAALLALRRAARS
jgi:uncharacterized repeat protein (TIGR01451 family)